MMETAVPGRRKRGRTRRRMDWQKKKWKVLELRRKTKLIGTNGKYFWAVVTPNREKPKEEDNTIKSI